MTPVLVFDIETVPDVAGLRRLRAEWRDFADAEVAECAFEERRGKSGGGDFLPLYLQRIVAISCVLRNDAGFRVGSIGAAGDTEAALIQSFFGMIDRHTPQMVSWNGSCFDLPVLHYRGLLAGVSAQRYWELGADDPEFRYNNYIGRYHTRHTDLMDVLSMYQSRASAPLDVLSKLAGYPGKLGMDGSQVWQAYSRRPDRADQKLLRNRRRQYLPVVQSLSENARRARRSAAHAPKRRWCAIRCKRLPAPHWREYLDAWPRCGCSVVSGERFEVEIESLDQEGRGVAHREGKAVFIEGALPGERVVYERQRQKRATKPAAQFRSSASLRCASCRAARMPDCTSARAVAARCSTSTRVRRSR